MNHLNITFIYLHIFDSDPPIIIEVSSKRSPCYLYRGVMDENVRLPANATTTGRTTMEYYFKLTVNRSHILYKEFYS